MTTVTATERASNISFSHAPFKVGAYIFRVVNYGNDRHTLSLAGPRITSTASPAAPGGESGALGVSLRASSCELWCGLDMHKMKRMDIKITVA